MTAPLIPLPVMINVQTGPAAEPAVTRNHPTKPATCRMAATHVPANYPTRCITVSMMAACCRLTYPCYISMPSAYIERRQMYSTPCLADNSSPWVLSTTPRRCPVYFVRRFIWRLWISGGPRSALVVPVCIHCIKALSVWGVVRGRPVGSRFMTSRTASLHRRGPGIVYISNWIGTIS